MPKKSGPSPSKKASKKEGNLPPKTDVFERNDSYKLHRGFAFKVPAEKAIRNGLNPGKEKVVWLSPDGKEILDEKRATLNNARRRAALNLSDSWNDYKAVDPEGAKELGWNAFQKQMRGTKGSRIGVLQKFEGLGIDVESLDMLMVAADGEKAENNGWGDSG